MSTTMDLPAGQPSPTDISSEDWEACLRVLRVLSRDPMLAPDPLTFKGLIKRTYQTAKKKIRDDLRASERPVRLAEEKEDRTLLRRTVRAKTDAAGREISEAPDKRRSAISIGRLHRNRDCYCCSRRYRDVHFFYANLCPECATLNWSQRSARVNLEGRIAVVTGGRIKIGFQAALKLLRDGARVIVTSRFPADAVRRFQCEGDFDAWSDRLAVHGLDFRDLAAVETLIDTLLQSESHLDILVNNAAQTQSRPPAYIHAQLANERQALTGLSPRNRRLIGSAARRNREMAFIDHVSEPAPRDRFGEPVDCSQTNSSTRRLGEIGLRELLEVQVVNGTVPFMLCGRLKPLLLRSPFAKRFIVNVTSLEGQFDVSSRKREFHPHTNMAKAALNMLTRTSASDYARDQIYMNSVDPGWVSQEGTLPQQVKSRAAGFITPLDTIDAAARIYAPIIDGLAAPRPMAGRLFKNYREASW